VFFIILGAHIDWILSEKYFHSTIIPAVKTASVREYKIDIIPTITTTQFRVGTAGYVKMYLAMPANYVMMALLDKSLVSFKAW
jgi:hypothetical protein